MFEAMRYNKINIFKSDNKQTNEVNKIFKLKSLVIKILFVFLQKQNPPGEFPEML